MKERFLYKCVLCSCPETSNNPSLPEDVSLCSHCPGKLIRNWRGEAVGFARVPGGGRPHSS